MRKNLLFSTILSLFFLQATSQLPNCPQQPGQIPNFSGTPAQVNPANLSQAITNDGNYTVGEVFRYTNAVTVPVNINAFVYIEAIQNSVIRNFDNNASGVVQRFQPTIQPNPANLTAATQEGWVQFRIEFRYNGGASNGQLVNLASGLQFRHYDIDGHTNGATGFFKETGWTTGQNGAYLIAPTDLTSGGEITDAGPPANTTWKKILGQAAEHDGASSDPNVVYTSQFGTVNTVRFRMGYLFVKGDGGNIANQVAREYAAEFGCFDLSNAIPLPVKLESFSGAYKNDKVTLNWSTSAETNFSRFEVERSFSGTDYNVAGMVLSYGTPASTAQYEFPDNVAAVNSNLLYYRLKMIDNDGRFYYSPVVIIRKENIQQAGISVFPNPVVENVVQLKISSSSRNTISIRIIDLNGKILSEQVRPVIDGNNSLAVDLPLLKSGVYTMQVITREKTMNAKFAVLK